MRAGSRDASDVIDPTRIEEVGAKSAGQPSWGDMAINAGPLSGPERTHALVEEIAGRRGAQLRGQVAVAKRGASPELIEEAFQEACLRASRSCRGQTIDEVYKYLLKTTDSIVDDMRDRLKREVLVDHSAREFRTVDPSLAPPDEVMIKREERAELDELTFAILDRLDERERKVAILHSHGLARNDIARHLGVTPRTVKRDVEGILTTGRQQLAKLVGCGCPDGHSLVSRYAFGLASDRDARRAQLHLAMCARCGAMYERLDVWRERVAAVLPVPPAVEANTQIVERVVHAGTDVLASGSSPTVAPSGLRRHVAEAAASLREHTTAVYYRTLDPTPLAGVRPGAVAAAVAGCLAVGGGTTYCVQQGADPFTALSQFSGPAREEKKSKPRPKPARKAQSEAPPVVTPPVSEPPAMVQQPPPPPPTTQEASLPPAPEDEFEPSSPGGTSTSAQTASSSPARQAPAPAPADGPGEFTGP
jgi:RNA polymerase sigma factor (sigma-70 family)